MIILAGLMVAAIVGCSKDEKDTPPIAHLPSDSILTLADLRAMIIPGQTYSFGNSGKNLYATVTMDELNGNIYRQAYIQDGTSAVNLRMNPSATLRVGDSIRVALKGTTISYFNNMFQLDSLNGRTNIVLQARDKNLEPETVTISDILSGGYQAKLVKLENVQFIPAELGQTWADGINKINVNRTLQDCDNNTIIVRTSGYADFADDVLPEGRGSFTGIVGQFGDVWQLYVRDPKELQMNEERCVIDTGESGSGTFEDPYNVAYAINNNSGTGVWVEGYIVGVMETGSSPFQENFTGPFNTNSNLLLAGSPGETSTSAILYVQLPIGSVRDALNLVDNPGRLGTYVKVKGNLTTYFSSPGMRETSEYWAEGGTEPDPVETVFEETFTTNLGSFTAFNITGAQEWHWVNFDGGSAYMNGFAGGAQPNEDWLVSPAISLAGKSNAVLQIREAINFLTNYNDLKVLIASDYDGSNPTSSGTWVHITGFNRPAGNNWTYVNSGDIDISQFDGQTIHVALQYTSTNSGASGWQVSRIKIEAE